MTLSNCNDDAIYCAYNEPQSIIVVDDEEGILKIVSQFIEFLGFSVRTVQNSLDVLRLMEEEEATIVITDLLMPRMDGMELIKELKSRWPDVDVIVMTGYAKDFSYTDVINVGASDFIQKPFNLNELEAKLRRIIKERNLRGALRRLSTRDVLTDLFNRRYFEQRIEEEAERAFRQQYPLFLLIVDIDKFKPINDNYGHEEGDKILKMLADVLISSTRKHVDSCFRFGGDEFAIIVPQASIEQVINIAERICSNFASLNTRGATLSIGIAQFVRTDNMLRDDLSELIRCADEAMYIAKKDGGNNVVVHQNACEA